jgi:outer membrane protein
MIRQGSTRCDSRRNLWWPVLLLVYAGMTICPQAAWGQAGGPVITLQDAIRVALERNLDVQLSREEIDFARNRQNEAGTGFLPKVSAEYGYRRPSGTSTMIGGVNIRNQDQNNYHFTGTVEQPIFTGFATLSTYELARLGLNSAKIQLDRSRLDIIFRVKETYIGIIQAEKIREVAEQSVRQLQENLKVAENFYRVGLSPKIDVLDAETRLGDAELQLIRAVNDVAVRKANLNTVLRQSVDTPVEVEDILTTAPYERSYEASQETALKYRPEVLDAETQVASAEQQITFAKSGYYPNVTFRTNLYRLGDTPGVDGSEFTQRQGWDVGAVATWTLFEWGKTRYAVFQQEARLRQAKETLEKVKDTVRLDVKSEYLTLRAAYEAIGVARKAVVSAEENFRISTERYKEQVATSTEVLDAQTRLTQAKSNYTNAIAIFNVEVARLIRAMGLEEGIEPL